MISGACSYIMPDVDSVQCDGRLPCRACTLKGRECNRQTIDMRRRGLTVPDEALERSHSPGDQDKEQSVFLIHFKCTYDDTNVYSPTTKELAVRLDRIENQLSSLVSSISRGLGGLDGSTSEPVSPQDHRTNHGPRSLGFSSIKSTPNNSVPMFSGETSIAHTLDQVENHLAHIGGDENRHSAATSQIAKTSLPPSPIPRGEVDDENHEQIYIRQVLNDFDIEPDRQCWDEFLDTFCEEVHILYPMLHLPTLRLTYIKMWGKHLLSPECELGHDDSRFSIAQVWICLAIGRCTQSARIHGEDGRHSAGWSLYDAAMHLIGDLLSSFRECSSPKLILQTLVLIVCSTHLVLSNSADNPRSSISSAWTRMKARKKCWRSLLRTHIILVSIDAKLSKAYLLLTVKWSDACGGVYISWIED